MSAVAAVEKPAVQNSQAKRTSQKQKKAASSKACCGRNKAVSLAAVPIVALAGYTLVRALRHRKEPSTRGVPAAATNGNDGTASLKSGLSRRLAKTGDLHLLDAWDDLDDLEQEMLAKDIESLNLERVRRAFKASMDAEGASASSKPEPIDPSDVATLAGTSEKERSAWWDAGLRAIAEGKVAAVLLAGGQGTRLGFSGPKGCYDIGLPSHKSLFCLQAERIAKLQRLAADVAFGKGEEPQHKVQWYVMTSPATHRATEDAFAEEGWFGLDASQVHFFQQGSLPSLTTDGAPFLETDWRVARNPDGNGGLYGALAESGCLAEMRAAGVECVDVVSVDNALVRVCDPTFLGFCLGKGVELGARTVSKAGPEERVGVLVRSGGGLAVKEYSELGEESAREIGEDGELRFRWGNICMHFMTVDFLERCAKSYGAETNPIYHIARKTMPGVKGPVEGVKLERFIFDPFPLAKSAAVFEVDRDEEFAPVKNAPGAQSDSPDTAREMLLRLHRKWVERAGARVTDGPKLPGQIKGGVEVAPMLSYSGEGLDIVCKGQTYQEGMHVSARTWLRTNSQVAKALKGLMDTPLKSNKTSRAQSIRGEDVPSDL